MTEHRSKGEEKKMNFRDDLAEVSAKAACYLRKKYKKLNENLYDEDDYTYSGEREFYCEIYSRLLCKNQNYRDFLFVEAYGPTDADSTVSVPDLVFNKEGEKGIVVEIKEPVGRKVKGDVCFYKNEVNRINIDYYKLQNDYEMFDSKILLIAFLGDPEKYDEQEFKSYVNKMWPSVDNIEVLVC